MHNTSLFDFPRSYFQHLLNSDPDYKHPLYREKFWESNLNYKMKVLNNI